ncbi:MAG: hypothetical protein ACO1O3_16250 [Sphingobium sp.]
MQTVTFARPFPHVRGLETTYFEAGWSGEITNEIAAAAHAAGALEKENAGGSDQAGAAGDADSAEG